MRKAAVAALLTAGFGLAVGLVPFGYDLEVGSGLGLLFKLRGERPAPPVVTVVSEDQESSTELGLPRDPRDWPRAYHARLIRRLAREGASVIAFDHFFADARGKDDDRMLADAMREAGNVVVTGNLEMQVIGLKDSTGHVVRRMTMEKLTPPTPVLARQAVSFAPFPLPRVPVTVNRYWTFKQSVGVPTLPVVAFQIYALPAYGDFRNILKRALRYPEGAAVRKLARGAPAAAVDALIALNGAKIKGVDAVNAFIRRMRTALGPGSPVGRLLMRALNDPTQPSPPAGRKRLLKALVGMYRGGDSRYLNYYGPAQSITTVSYAQALLHSHPVDVNGNAVDFKGKAVFIGESNGNAQRQGDYYHTYFSRPDGRDHSGVEIAATAFANLWEGSSLNPVGPAAYVFTIILFGLAAGTICYLLGPIAAAFGSALLILMYIGIAYYEFVDRDVWFPVIIPVAVQAPFAFVAAVLWKYFDARKLEAAHERLKEIDRVKTLFLSQVSHELRTPLSSIKGFVDNMLDGLTGELQDRQRDYLFRVRSNTNRLSRMITNLLDLSRIESGTQRLERDPLPVCELVNDAVTQLHLIAESRKVTLETLCRDSVATILADHDKFIQIITNLVDNAIKFTAPGGRVTVAVDRQGGDQVMVTVTDTGSGIPAGVTADQLFEPFYQAKQRTGMPATGLGLGLSIVKTLVDLHGGTISVRSQEGKGTEFCIMFPTVNGEATGDAAAGATGLPPSSDGTEGREATDTDSNTVRHSAGGKG